MRRIALIVGLLITGTMMWNCGGTDDGSGVTTVKLVVWKPNNPAAWDSALVLFHNAHPDIRIVREIGPHSSSQFHDLVAQKLRNRDASVDAFLMDVVWTPEFAAAGWAIPLDDRFPPMEQEKFFDGCIEADLWEGSIYGVPLNIDAGILYYRADLLEKYNLSPPATWADMVEQIVIIQAGENDPNLHGFSGQFRQYEGLVCDMLEFVQSNGGRLTEPSSPETMDAIEFVRSDLIGRAAPRGVLTYSEQESLDLFTSGGAIFHRNWPYAWALAKESGISGKVGIARLPAFKEGMSASALGGWRFGISPFSRQQDVAWTVVEFFTSPEIQKHFAVVAGRAPARKALYQDADVLAANPHFADMYPVFETATPRPRTPVYPQVSNILQRFLHTALSEESADLATLAGKAAVDIEKAMSTVR
jgi:multiple sugar transport system substrate-binding protein